MLPLLLLACRVLDLLSEPSRALSELVLKQPLVHQRLPPAGESPSAQGAQRPLWTS